MKRNFFLVSFLLFCFSASAQELPIAPYLPAQQAAAETKQAPITVQFPYENMTLPRHAQQVYLFGQVHVQLPATLDINGQAVELFKNGAFIAYLPVTEGTFEFVLTAQSGGKTYQAVRRVQVPGKNIQALQPAATLDEEEVFPASPVVLYPGDELPLSVRGTPGAQVTARLPGLKKGEKIELTENAKTPGLYETIFTLSSTQKPKKTHVIYTLKHPGNRTHAKLTAPAEVTVRAAKPPYTYAQINTPGIKLRKRPTASGNLYPDYRAFGPVQIVGERDGQYHIRLNSQEKAWLEKSRLEALPDFTQTPNILSFIRQNTSEKRTRFVFRLGRPVPIQIHEYPDRLELALYYLDGFEQNFSLDMTSPVVSSVDWTEPAEHTLAFKLNFPQKAPVWGYGYRFEENDLIVDIFHTPTRTPQPGKPLAGVRLALDAGHSPKRQVPYDGAVGPTGYLEYEGTLALAEELKPLLEQAGATVLMSRQGSNQMSLQDRYDYALDNQADLFISLHYNALPETADPLAKPRGFSVYYTYPHSLKLAQSIHASYAKNVPLADTGLFENTVLFIPRMSEYPSILVENAFLILPEQEELARTREGRALFVKALYEGILKFYGATPADVANASAKRSKPRQ